MSKYLIFRSMSEICNDDDNFDEDAETELVAVEYGHTYYEAIEDIVAAINADLSGLPESEYAEVSCQEEEPLQEQYVASFLGIISPARASTNILKQYFVEERPDDEY